MLSCRETGSAYGERMVRSCQISVWVVHWQTAEIFIILRQQLERMVYEDRNKPG